MRVSQSIEQQDLNLGKARYLRRLNDKKMIKLPTIKPVKIR